LSLRRGEEKSRISRVKYWKTALAISAVLSASHALADDFKTTDGTEYKNAKVSRVEPDGVVLKFSGGIVKILFTELSPEIQKKYGYDPKAAGDFQQQTYQAGVARARQSAEVMEKWQQANASTGAIDSQGPADLMSRAESALRTGQFGQGAELLNRIVSEHPGSPQAKTVGNLRSLLRDKEPTQDGPLAASEAQRLRSLMDSLSNIKRGYRTTTPEKRRALETILGTETFRDTDNGLDSVSSCGAKLRDAGKEEGAKIAIQSLPRGMPSGDVIESQIDGEFEGWEGETVVKLINGQIWQQTEYHYTYHYAYRPEVLVYRSSSGYKMKVEGVDEAVGVTRLR
jgi:hypothetical protein